MPVPLLIFDTNLLLDFLFKRDSIPALIVALAEQGRVDLRIPELVITEFRGTAMRTAREFRRDLNRVVGLANQIGRCEPLERTALELKAKARSASTVLDTLTGTIDTTIQTLRRAATIESHTAAIHLAGDLRYVGGYPPDDIRQGAQDCRIFEAVLAIARDDRGAERPIKAFLTRDKDFDVPELHEELSALDFAMRSDVGAVYGDCR